MAVWVILGCGYTGARLADRLFDNGESFIATTRRHERAAELQSRWNPGSVAVLDAQSPEALVEVVKSGAIVVDSIPPSGSDGALERLIATGCARASAQRIVYLSSTGVYGRGEGRGEGDWIDEDTVTGPIAERGARRLAAETALLATARDENLPAVALRIGGIYGPGRGVLSRLRRGDYRIYGEGRSLVSRIHVDDLVGAIICAARVEELQREIYCIVDDEPTSSREHADGIAALLGIEPAPSVPLSEASASVRSMLDSNRRVSNRRAVAELGWELSYPTWRQGAASLLKTPAS